MIKPYGTLELTISSPAQSFAEKLGLVETKAFLVVHHALDDEMISALISSARATAEYFYGDDLIQKQYDLWLDCFPICEITLRRPLQSVDLIQHIDSGNVTETVDTSGYLVDTSRGIVTPAYGETWPSFTRRPSSAVLVRFTSGYPASHPFWENAGKRILQGMKFLIAEWYERRIPAETDADDLPGWLKGMLGSGLRQRVY